MTPAQVIISFFIAAIMTGIFAGFFRSAGPWKGFWNFLIIIFIVTLAASQWVTPIGQPVWGYYWVPGLFVAIIFSILIAAVTPKGKRRFQEKNIEADKSAKTYFSPHEGDPKKRIYEGDEPASSVALGGFFWLFILTLLIVVIIGAIH